VANGTEISRKSFKKFQKLLNLRNTNHSTENSRNSGSKVEWKEKQFREKVFENMGIPREVVHFFGNFGECSSIHYWKLPKTQTGVLGRMESAFTSALLTQVSSRSPHLILKHAEVKKKTKQNKTRLLVVVYNAWGFLW